MNRNFSGEYILQVATALRHDGDYESLREAEVLERAVCEALLDRGLPIPDDIIVGPVRP